MSLAQVLCLEISSSSPYDDLLPSAATAPLRPCLSALERVPPGVEIVASDGTQQPPSGDRSASAPHQRHTVSSVCCVYEDVDPCAEISLRLTGCGSHVLLEAKGSVGDVHACVNLCRTLLYTNRHL